MNKAYFMSFVLAAALPAMATEDAYSNTYTNFLKGVTGELPATGVPTAAGGTWDTTNVTLTNSNGKVDFETSSSPLKLANFTPGPADTNTIVKVELMVSVADVGELMTSNELADAQTAFAVCTNAYHAWNGTAWVVLGDTIAEVGDDSLTTNLTVEISYLGSNSTVRARMARFTIGDTTLVARSASTDLERAGWVALATPANNFTGFGASGSGLLSKVDAEVMLGVAEYAGVKYGTLTEAVAEAAKDPSAPVEVLRETEENITLPEGASGIKIADNGKVSGTITAGESVNVNIQPSKEDFTSTELAGKDGVYTIPVKVSGGNVSVKLPETMSNKEIVLGSIQHVDSTVKVTIQTARTVLEGASPDGSRALSVSTPEKEAALRKYLSDNLYAAYVDAHVSASSLSDALAQNSSNGLKHYQNYALGIEPSDSVKPVATSPEAGGSGNLVLSIPALVGKEGSGDYTVKYMVNGTEQTGADSINIPLGTGSYTVKIVFK